MRFETLKSSAISKNAAESLNPAQTIWRGAVLSQEAGIFQHVDESGNPLFENNLPVMGTSSPTGWVMRQNGDERHPFYPIYEGLEVGTYPSLTAQNIGENVRGMNGFAVGLDLALLDGRPLFAKCDSAGVPALMTDEEIEACFQEGEFVTPENCVVHNGVLYVAKDHITDSDDTETPKTVYVQFLSEKPLLVAGYDEEFNPVYADYEEAKELIHASSKAVHVMESQIRYGRSRTYEAGAGDLDYLNVVGKRNWPTTTVKRGNQDEEYDASTIDWDACRAHEATLIRLIRNCRALARAYPDQFLLFPEYCKPVEAGGYIYTMSNAPSKMAKKRASNLATASGINKPVIPSLGEQISNQIPSPDSDLANA